MTKLNRILDVTRGIITIPFFILGYFSACIVEALVEGFKSGY